LAERPVLGRDVFQRPVAETGPGEYTAPLRPLEVGDLIAALGRLLERRARNMPHRVEGERLTLRDGLAMVLERLHERRRCTFEEIFPEDASRLRIIVVFLALLELVRLRAVTAVQVETHAAIDIVLVSDVDPEEILDVFEGEAEAP